MLFFGCDLMSYSIFTFKVHKFSMAVVYVVCYVDNTVMLFPMKPIGNSNYVNNLSSEECMIVKKFIL